MGASFPKAAGGARALCIAPSEGSSVWVYAVLDVSGAELKREIAADFAIRTLLPKLDLRIRETGLQPKADFGR